MSKIVHRSKRGCFVVNWGKGAVVDIIVSLSENVPNFPKGIIRLRGHAVLQLLIP